MSSVFTGPADYLRVLVDHAAMQAANISVWDATEAKVSACHDTMLCSTDEYKRAYELITGKVLRFDGLADNGITKFEI